MSSSSSAGGCAGCDGFDLAGASDKSSPRSLGTLSGDYHISHVPVLFVASLWACCCFSHWTPDNPDSIDCVFSLFSPKTCLCGGSFRYRIFS